MGIVYQGRPDWEFLPRFVDPFDYDLAWPFLIGSQIVSTDRAMVAWTAHGSCGLSIEWLSRNSNNLNKARRFIGNLISRADAVDYQTSPWMDFELEGEDPLYFDGHAFDRMKVSSLPRLKMVGLAKVNCDDGNSVALFMRWGYQGTAVLLPVVKEQAKG